MKKIILLVVLLVSAVSMRAQQYYGSKEGGFAICFDADPVLHYIGNMFNNSTDNSFANGDIKGLGSECDVFKGISITGKYMLKDNLAMKATFGFDNSANKSDEYNNSKDLEDQTGWSINDAHHQFSLGVGVDYLLRPGERLQPIFGAQLVYTHVNDYTKTYKEENKDAWQNKEVSTLDSKRENGIGLIANVGVEYYMWKQVSVSANLNFGALKRFNSVNHENSSNEKGDYTRPTGADYTLKTGQFGGNIGLNFYF